MELAYADEGYTGEAAEADAAEHGIQRAVVKLPEAKRGFVLLPRRWGVERTFSWLRHFRRRAKDYERLPKTLRALHFLAFLCLTLGKVVAALMVGA